MRATRIWVIACMLAMVPLAHGADPAISVQTRDIVLDYSWGYLSGVKQHLGTYKDGRSAHVIARYVSENPDPSQGKFGNPDFLVWVDENTDEAIAYEHPAGNFGVGVNPGGNVVFASDVSAGEQGRLWSVLGARAYEIPFDITRSSGLFDASSFDVVLNDFVTEASSTTPVLSVVGDTGLLIWRHLRSTHPDVAVRFDRYDLQSGTPTLATRTDLGRASTVPALGEITIEQLWSRWDPRRRALAVTWQWFDKEVTTTGEILRFGANPFLYTEDAGATWKRADGSPVALPLTYAGIDSVVSPYDHLIRGETAGGYTRDLGFTPNGTPWMVGPAGAPNRIELFFWRNTAWERRSLTTDLEVGDPLACGTTRSYLVCIYSEFARQGELLARVSRNNGLDWSAPVKVGEIGLTPTGSRQRINWASFVQPADGYPDNVARFFYSYWDTSAAIDGLNFRNNIRWIRLDVADANQAPAVDISAPVDGETYAIDRPVALIATTSDPDGDTVTVTWRANGSPVVVPWTPVAGSYSVVANADDGNGGSASDSVSITVVENRSPSVVITSPLDGSDYVADTTIPLTASSSDPDDDPVTVSWTANGSAITSPWNPSPGSYVVVATASDGSGGKATDSVSITVTIPNLNPTVDITSPADGSSHAAGTAIALSAATSDPDGDPVTVAWKANGNPIAAPWTPVAGTYTVVATASDGKGGSATDTVSTTVTANGAGTLPATVAAAGVNPGTAARIVDTLNGVQNLATSWSNDGANSTAWFTLDLGSSRAVERLMMAPRGGVKYTFTVTIGNTLSGGKVSGAATGSCVINGPTTVPTSLTPCAVSGVGRYVTVQGSRPWLIFHGIEVVGSAPANANVLPATIHDAGANDATAPRIIDVLNGAQNLTTSWTNDGVNTTAWFTLDLGAPQSIGRLMIAPRGGLKYVLTITIGNTVAGGKATGAAAGTCTITGPTTVPTALTLCPVSGTGRYVTVQGNRPYLVFHGIEAWKP
jgi:hypothetical protein